MKRVVKASTETDDVLKRLVSELEDTVDKFAENNGVLLDFWSYVGDYDDSDDSVDVDVSVTLDLTE